MVQTLLLAFRSEVNPHLRHGRILWMARIARGLSREELAAQLGVCREAVRLWEVGKRSIDGVMLGRLALALDQDAAMLTGVIDEDYRLRQQFARQGLRQFWDLEVGERFRILTAEGSSSQILEKISPQGPYGARRVGGDTLYLVRVDPPTIVQVLYGNRTGPD